MTARILLKSWASPAMLPFSLVFVSGPGQPNMSDEKRELRVTLERVPPQKGTLRQRAHNTNTGAAVSQGGTDTQRVTPGSSDETRQQSTVDEDDVSTDEEVVPTDITYPSSKCRPESTLNEQQPVRANEHQPVRATYQPYHCDLCSISFKNQLELKRHQNIHHAQRPFVCKGCHKIFIRKGILHLHLRLRSEDGPFYCAACSRKSRRTDGVKTHVPTPDTEQS